MSDLLLPGVTSVLGANNALNLVDAEMKTVLNDAIDRLFVIRAAHTGGDTSAINEKLSRYHRMLVDIDQETRNRDRWNERHDGAVRDQP